VTKQALSYKSIKVIFASLCFMGMSFLHADLAEVQTSLAKVLPNVQSTQIKETPVKDIYSVDLGDRFAYITGDGKYIFTGQLFDVESSVNYTELALGEKRVEKINAIPEEYYITFPAKNKKHSITVFTDIDCGYCRKLHNEIDELNELGIEVKYLLRPRSGPQSVSWQKADSVFCSKNQQKNLTRSKQGIDITVKTCDDAPTDQVVQVAQSMGFHGTPAILSELGSQLGGYLPAKELVERLDLEKEKSKAQKQNVGS